MGVSATLPEFSERTLIKTSLMTSSIKSRGTSCYVEILIIAINAH